MSSPTSRQPIFNRTAAKRFVRHFLADFAALEREYPAGYPKMIVSGDGAYVFDEDGHRLLDAGSHLGACQIGHGRERGRRAHGRAGRQARVHRAGRRHLAHLCGRARRAPGASWSPATSRSSPSPTAAANPNELAFKIARTYHARRGEPERTKIISRLGSYHGSTIATSAATGVPPSRPALGRWRPTSSRRRRRIPAGTCRAATATPGGEESLADTEALIEREGPETVAAIIAEPIAIPQAVKIPDARVFHRACGSFAIAMACFSSSTRSCAASDGPARCSAPSISASAATSSPTPRA